MPRGGFRPGSGRKPLEGDRRTTSFNLPLDLINLIQRQSKKESEATGKMVSASAIAQQWLEAGRSKS